jgi:hypothetical protein
MGFPLLPPPPPPPLLSYLSSPAPLLLFLSFTSSSSPLLPFIVLLYSPLSLYSPTFSSSSPLLPFSPLIYSPLSLYPQTIFSSSPLLPFCSLLYSPPSQCALQPFPPLLPFIPLLYPLPLPSNLFLFFSSSTLHHTPLQPHLPLPSNLFLLFYTSAHSSTAPSPSTLIFSFSPLLPFCSLIYSPLSMYPPTLSSKVPSPCTFQPFPLLPLFYPSALSLTAHLPLPSNCNLSLFLSHPSTFPFPSLYPNLPLQLSPSTFPFNLPLQLPPSTFSFNLLLPLTITTNPLIYRPIRHPNASSLLSIWISKLSNPPPNLQTHSSRN